MIGKWIVFIALAAAVLLLYKIGRGFLQRQTIKTRSGGTGNVIPIHRAGNIKGKAKSSQPCSYCRKKSNKLAFYSDEAGAVIGLCKDCRSKADRRGLMRL
ncbi:hypothetical protein [Paenibacillus turpanensis]|uniref:hypothetical protein n=1 Tax=Paenibacillus turpanensis TaxID=2689078 RepID=UPI0014087E10|nr:hypothetical protein [Paenibacillus turpanensis]